MNDSNSERVEMYLKTVAELGGDLEPVSIGRVADRLGVTPASANEMMKRLGESGFIDHLPYKGVTLTTEGRRLANSVIRRQRLWECFLVERLNLDWARAFEMACDLEHATAPEVTEALAVFLNNPTRCPHGNPIPDAADRSPDVHLTPLSELRAGGTGCIRAVAPESSDVLAYLAERELLPGRQVKVLEVAPMQGPLTLRIDRQTGDSGADRQVVLGKALAGLVMVEMNACNES
ncbi:MAG: metal-dependent transcriptional regulator [Chloroflexota bacterium]|jgi:DtxR family Mn-dependent transcriptional regulator